MDHFETIKMTKESVQRTAQLAAKDAADIIHKHNLPPEVERFIFTAVKQLGRSAAAFTIAADNSIKLLEINQQLARFTEAVKQVLIEDGYLKEEPDSGAEEQTP